jgi:hypothetical protein
MSSAKRLLLIALLGFGVVLGVPSAARANGDPASDFLLSQDVFVPGDVGVTPTRLSQLQTLVEDAKARGFRIKVALIATRADLGSVGVLWRRPQEYAQFLGQELAFVYRGRLLIVMPNGFGIYHFEQSTTKEKGVLGRLSGAPGGDGTAAAAVAAVEQLAAAEGVKVTPRPLAPSGGSNQGRNIFLLVGAGALLLVTILMLVLGRRSATGSLGQWFLLVACAVAFAVAFALVGVFWNPISTNGSQTSAGPGATSQSGTSASPGGRGHASAVIAPPEGRLKRGWILLVTGGEAESIAARGDYLAWELVPMRAGDPAPLMERDQNTGKIRKLAAETFPGFGLAATPNHVVFAQESNSGVELLAIRHDGSDRIVLSRSLAAPIASRGDLVAWAEQSGSLQQVVVRNMSTHHEWMAARMPRCLRGRCYRIDAVTLADDGVVFARGATGPHPSLIVRRRFHDSKPTVAEVPDDPQPELANSSNGALYYWLLHGWMRWDFGQKRPHLVDLRGVQPWLLGFERGRLLLLTGPPCRPRLVVQSRSHQKLAIDAPASTPASPREFGPLCRRLTDLAWKDGRLLVAWSVVPEVSQSAANEVGLVGVVTATRVP